MRYTLLFSLACLGLLLAGCGGMAPLHRAHDVLFDVPYVTKEQKHDELTLGIKKLSVPEVTEIFCRAEKLLESYQVYYMRAHNVGKQTYFVHLLNSQLPTRADIEPYFNPHSTMSTIAHFVMMVPIGIGISQVAADTATYFLSFIGVSIGLHIIESYALGSAGYDKLAKFAVVTDPDRGTPGLTVLPYRHEHYLLFMPRNDSNAAHIRVSVARKDMVTKELSFDMSGLLTTSMGML